MDRRQAHAAILSGMRNAITDVPGVRVGHPQAESGERSGVTVVAPPSLPTPAGAATVNGMGELTGKLEIDERGIIETPVYLCGSHAVGTVFQAAVLASGRGPDNIVLPVVGECDDGDMADSRTVAIGDVDAALEALGDEVAEGSVGAGTGMVCFGYPGGIGTASRRVDEHHVGVLLLCNFGAGVGGRIAYLESQHKMGITNHVVTIGRTADDKNPYMIDITEREKPVEAWERDLFAKKTEPPKAITNLSPSFKSVPLMNLAEMRRAYGSAGVPSGFQPSNPPAAQPDNLYAKAAQGGVNISAFGS